MSAHDIKTELRKISRDAVSLENACRSHWGISATMFRTAKFVFYIATLAAMGYLIEYAAVDPFVAMAFAVLLISGPEGLELWLVRQGAIDRTSQSSDDD